MAKISSEKVLRDSSTSFEKTFDAFFDSKFDQISEEKKRLWAVSSLIHLDQCRLFEAFDSCPVEGFPRLLWMSEIISKLYEAKKWYFSNGIKLLHELAHEKNRLDEIKRKIELLRKKNDLKCIDRFKKYRNKFSFHYDQQAMDYLREFSKEDYDEYINVCLTFGAFSKEWLLLAKDILST